MKKLLMVLLGMMFVSPSSFANTRFSIVGGMNYGLDSASSPDGLGGTVSVKGDIGYGAGVLVNFSAVELGALYLSKTYTASFLGVSMSSTAQSIHIPVMYRMGGLTSFGIGGFYELPMGSATTSNYGLTAGPRFAMTNGFFLDLRFNYGLSTGNSKDALALVGYSFGK